MQSEAKEIVVVPHILLETAILPESLRRALRQVKDGGYITLARLLPSLEVPELQELLRLGVEARACNEIGQGLVLFGALMACHEGIVVRDDEQAPQFFSRLLVYVQAELLSRRGLVELPYYQLTLERVNPAHLKVTVAGQARFSAASLAKFPPDSH